MSWHLKQSKQLIYLSIHGISLLNKIILHKPPSRVHEHSLGGGPGGIAPWSSWVLSILRSILNEISFLYFCSWHIGKTLWFWILYIKFSCQYYIKVNQNFYTIYFKNQNTFTLNKHFMQVSMYRFVFFIYYFHFENFVRETFLQGCWTWQTSTDTVCLLRPFVS